MLDLARLLLIKVDNIGFGIGNEVCSNPEAVAFRRARGNVGSIVRPETRARQKHVMEALRTRDHDPLRLVTHP